MNTTTHRESLRELKEFIHQQAADDAPLPPSDRRHQAEVVTDVIDQEHLGAKVQKSLLDEYFGQVNLLRTA